MSQDIELIQISDAAKRPLSEEVIPGLLDDGLVMVVAAERTGKTYLLISIAVHVASGRNWGMRMGLLENGERGIVEEGRPVKKGMVVYCIAEGTSFFVHRMTTACDEFGVRASELPLYILDNSFNLMISEDGQPTEAHKQLLEQIHAREAECGQACRMLVFDTLNRFMIGDENKQEDSGRLIAGVGWFRKQLGCSVVLVHHTNKDGGLVRGSTVFTGAADQVLVCHRDKAVGNKLLWTTEGTGKRKDRSPVNEWTEFCPRPITDGEATAKNEYEDEVMELSDHILWQETYNVHGEPTMEVFEETSVMKHCEPPTPGDELKSKAAQEILKAMTGDTEYTTQELIKVTNQPSSSIYSAVKQLRNVGRIEYVGKTRRLRMAGTTNPFGE